MINFFRFSQKGNDNESQMLDSKIPAQPVNDISYYKLLFFKSRVLMKIDIGGQRVNNVPWTIKNVLSLGRISAAQIWSQLALSSDR